MKYVGLLLAFTAFSLLLTGCVQQSGNGDVAALNASLALAQSQLASAEADKASCDANLAQANSDNQRLTAQVASLQSAAADSAQTRRTQLNSILAALNQSTQTNVSSNLFTSLNSQYASVDELACTYYLLAGGYSTGGSASIPLSCSLRLSDLLKTVKELNYYGPGCTTDSVRDLVNGYLNSTA